ncbi:TetR/AcrR family transcriptional regulator [Jonesiaceae bacterium BS-20]|uniref:TetR/AcrR family transcriptional regulator n=1 Tax=Jonesiaceae bacterium BS-20 TaxID=3120821 RepID=A0AAU7DZ07_9MICO
MPSATRPMQQRSVETRAAVILAAGVVFSKMSYAEARLKDISEEAGISPGSMYFQFGNKQDIARAVLESQKQRMEGALESAFSNVASAIEGMLSLNLALAELIASDPIVQGGIKLSTQPGTDLEQDAVPPYLEWYEVIKELLEAGIADGSVRSNIDINETAELLNEIFLGGQVLSGIEDAWASLPTRAARRNTFIRNYLEPV